MEITYEVECDSCAYINSVSDMNGNSDFEILNIINVGNGNAVNVNLDWDINFDQYIEKLATFNVDTNNVSIHNSKNSLSIKHKSSGGTGTNSWAIGKDYHSHILSTSSDRDGFTFKVPQYLLQLSTMTGNAYLNFLQDDLVEYNHEELLTEHKLKLTYDGIDGRSYVKKYKALVQSLYSIGSTTMESGDIIYNVGASKGILIEIKEIK